MTTAPHFFFLAQATAAPAAPTTTTSATTGAPDPGTAPSTSSPASSLMSFMPLVFMGIIFYFVLLRPQQKRAKDQANLVNSLKSGDEVLTSSGIYGRITNVNPQEKRVTVKVAENVRLEMARDSITTVLNRSSSAPAAGGDAKVVTTTDSVVAAKPVR